MTLAGTEPTLFAALATSRPVRVFVSSLMLAVLVLAIVATMLGAGLVHAHVTTGEKVATLEQIQREQAKVLADMREITARNEAQLEYIAKIALIGINDSRAQSGKPLLPDEMPRNEGK